MTFELAAANPAAFVRLRGSQMTRLTMLDMNAQEERVHQIDGDRLRMMRRDWYSDWIEQADLARYAGVSQSLISNLEWNRANRTNSVSLPVAEMIADYFECEVWELQTDEALILTCMNAPGVRDLPEDVARRFARALVSEGRSLAAARRAGSVGIYAPSRLRDESIGLLREAELSLTAAADLSEMYRAAAHADRLQVED